MRIIGGVVMLAALLPGCRTPGDPHVPAQPAAEEVRVGAAEPAPAEERCEVWVDPLAPEPRCADRLVATLQPRLHSDVTGTVTFREVEGGVRVTSDVERLPGDVHAYHVHLFGDCSAPDAESAGPHLNFFGPSEEPPEDIDRITGDLGELHPEAGEAEHETFLRAVRLRQLVGRSVVVHIRGNDPTQPPDGDAGERLACGVIGVAQHG